MSKSVTKSVYLSGRMSAPKDHGHLRKKKVKSASIRDSHRAGAGFSSIKRLGVFYFPQPPPGWDASPWQDYLQHQHEPRLYTLIEKGIVRETNVPSQSF